MERCGESRWLNDERRLIEPRLSLQYSHELVHITGTGLLIHAPRSNELPQWLRADDDVMNVVTAYQEAELSQTNIHACSWSCSLCPTFDTQSDYMAMHLEET